MKHIICIFYCKHLFLCLDNIKMLTFLFCTKLYCEKYNYVKSAHILSKNDRNNPKSNVYLQ